MLRLDAYLDRLPVLSEGSSEDGASDAGEKSYAAVDALSVPRLDRLLRIVQSLSTTSSSQPLLPAHRIRALLVQSDLPSARHGLDGDEATPTDPKTAYENEIEWLLVTKATVQVYGVILNALLDRIIPLSDDIWYWSEVLGSYAYSSLYTIQTSPLRWWAWSHDVYLASKARFRSVPADFVDSTATGMSQRWQQFYAIVRDSIRERSLANIQRKVLSPVALCRSEARRKQAQLRKLRGVTASGLGVLMDEGLQLGHDDDKSGAQTARSQRRRRAKRCPHGRGSEGGVHPGRNHGRLRG